MGNNPHTDGTEICIVKTCKDCGDTFDISRGELNFLEAHNLAVFERCYTCRKSRKEQREAKVAQAPRTDTNLSM